MPPDEGEDAAAGGVERDQRRLQGPRVAPAPCPRPIGRLQPPPDGALGLALRVGVDGGEDRKPRGAGRVRRQQAAELARDLVGDVERADGPGMRRRQTQRLAPRPLPRGLVERAVLDHRRQDAVAPGERRGRMLARRESVRRADDAGEEGALGGAELAERLREVGVRRLGEAVDRDRAVLAEVDRGEVAAEDLLLGRVRLEQERQHGFARLAPERAARRQEDVLRELLRDRAASLPSPPRAQVGEQRTGDGRRIDAGMVEEVSVLGGEHGGPAGGRRGIGAGVERAAAAAERGQHLGLEVERVERRAVGGADVRDAPALHGDARRARGGRPRRRRRARRDLHRAARRAVGAGHERVARGLPVAEAGELARERAARHRRVAAQHGGCRIDAHGAERGAREVSAHLAVEPRERDSADCREGHGDEHQDAAQARHRPPIRSTRWRGVHRRVFFVWPTCQRGRTAL